MKFPKYIRASISVGPIFLRRFPKSRPCPNLVPPRNPNNGVHPESDRRRSAGDAGVQSVLPAGELSDEVLLLPHPFMAAAPLCRRGLQRQDCRLCSRQDGGGNHRVPRPHHLPRCPQNSPQTRPRHQTHDCCSERHGTGILHFNCFLAKLRRLNVDLLCTFKSVDFSKDFLSSRFFVETAVFFSGGFRSHELCYLMIRVLITAIVSSLNRFFLVT